jgi:biopolymer transport protein TolR
MAQIESGSGGRKASLELNLIPFIDLMSVLITFLLITAVWSQVSMIQIGSSIYGKKTDTVPAPPPPDADVVLKLEVKANGYYLTIGKNQMSLPFVDSDYDDIGLVAQLEKAKLAYPNKVDAVIMMQDELPYERLIKGMDGLLKAGFSAISVATGGPN